MRIAVIADVHANLMAFEAVLDDARRNGGFDTVWCLGDVVGYGAQPSECIALLLSLPQVTIAGNHDLAAAGALSLDDFNPVAAEAARWTSRQLTQDEKDWLRALPQTHCEGEFTLVHGTLNNPVWEYLVEAPEAGRHLSRQMTPYCFVGHSHLPLIFYDLKPQPRGRSLRSGEDFDLGPARFVANPGSVGQPRDGDPRAAYALLNTETHRVVFHRVWYNIAVTQALMRKVGLPVYLANRLSYGR